MDLREWLTVFADELRKGSAREDELRMKYKPSNWAHHVHRARSETLEEIAGDIDKALKETADDSELARRRIGGETYHADGTVS